MKALFKSKAESAVKSGIARAKSRNNGKSGNTDSKQAGGSAAVTASPAKDFLAKNAALESRPGPNSGGGVDEAELMEGVDPVLQHLMRNARSETVQQQFLAVDEAEYTAEHSVKLLVGTYNVNGRKPPPGLDLRDWLDTEGSPDLVAVGFQEIVPLSYGNVMTDLVGGGGLDAAIAWDQLIEAALNGPPRFSRDISVQDGHIMAAPKLARTSAEGSEDTSTSGRRASEEQAAAPTEAAPGRALSATLSDEGYQSTTEDMMGLADASTAPPYVQVAAKQMVGVYISIWAHRRLVPALRGIQVTSIGTGVLGYLGNKGAVAARLRVYDSGLCFVAAHLSSGEGEGDEMKRNYDYSEIVRRGAFPPDALALDPAVMNPATTDGLTKVAAPGRLPGQWGGARGILASEHVIWMGDLNYRIGELDDLEVRALVRGGQLDELAQYDELTSMMRAGRAFVGWNEAPLTFPPTFKFRRGTSHYLGDEDDDASLTSGSAYTESDNPASPSGQNPEEKEKRRKPAWTDRVLWRSSHPDGMCQLTYAAAELTASDHRPVSAAFLVPVREYVRDKVEAAIDNARRMVDSLEMAAMPRCELEPTALTIGDVYYCQRRRVSLLLRNTGAVTANFQFMPLPGVMFGDPADKALRPAPRWADIHPTEGVLEPGEAIDVTLNIFVNGGPKGVADCLACAQDGKMDAILVLRIQGGNDIFLSIAGTYLPSFFGLSLACLSSLPRPLVRMELPPPIPLEESLGALRITSIKKSEAAGVGETADPPEFYTPTSSINDGCSPSDDGEAAEGGSRRKGQQRRGSLLGLTASGPASAPVSEANSPESEARQRSASVDQEPSTSGAGADEPHMPEAYTADPHRRPESASVLQLVPPELRHLTAYLRAQARLRTPGLFVNSAEALQNGGSSASSSDAIRQVREELDRGQPIPPGAGPHDVAATLLAFFAALPQPFMPHAAAQICDVCVPLVSAASSLLADALTPVEWAVFRHVTGLMRDALLPENSNANGLTLPALAALLAEAWFAPQAEGFGGAGGSMTPETVQSLQRLAERVSVIAERRAAFISLFLEPPAPVPYPQS